MLITKNRSYKADWGNTGLLMQDRPTLSVYVNGGFMNCTEVVAISLDINNYFKKIIVICIRILLVASDWLDPGWQEKCGCYQPKRNYLVAM
jgi:hypothetical protein